MIHPKIIILTFLLIVGGIIILIFQKKSTPTSESYIKFEEDYRFPNPSSMLDSLMGKTNHYNYTPPQGQYAFARKLPRRNNAISSIHNDYVVKWDQRGPANVGGRTRALAVDVSNENVIFAAGVSGGLWRSLDKGESWTKITRPDQNQFVTYIVQDTRQGKTNIWYYGTGERNGSASLIGTGDGIYKSTDGGLTFEIIPSTSFNDPQNFGNGFNWCWKIEINESNHIDDEIWVAADGFIFKSLNGGENWTTVFDGAYKDPVEGYKEIIKAPTDIVITENGIYYVTISQPIPNHSDVEGIWRSEDGINWVDIRPAVWHTRFGRVLIEVNPQDENVVYFWASCVPPEFDNSIWRYHYLSGDGSGDGGQWEVLPEDIFLNTQKGYNMLLKIKPDDSEVIYLGGRQLYRSEDTFSTGLLDIYHPYADYHNMIFSPHNVDEIIVACDGGVYRAFDAEIAQGSAFRDLNKGYITTQFYCVGIDKTTPDSDYIIGGTQDRGMWFTNSGFYETPWQLAGGGDVTACAIANGGRYYYFYGAFGIGLHRGSITSTGIITLNVTNIQHSDALSFARIFVVDPFDSNIIYFAASKLSEFNQGDFFNYIWRYDGLPEEEYSDEKWTVLEESRIKGITNGMAVTTHLPSHRLYFGDNKSNLYRIDSVNSKNPIFSKLTTPEIELSANAPVQNLIDIAVNPLNGNQVLVSYMGFEQKSIFYSNDAGMTWSHVGGNLEEFPDGSGNGPAIQAVAILPLDDNTTYCLAGGSTGLYSTTYLNGDQTIWVQEGMDNLGFSPVFDIQVRHLDNYVVVGTHGNGIYSTTIEPNQVSVDKNNLLPNHIYLSQNYPNPFNPITMIEYHITETSDVLLKIFNVQGEEIMVLVNEKKKDAGHYSLYWDSIDKNGKSVSGGVYIYQLKAGNFNMSKKMILLK